MIPERLLCEADYRARRFGVVLDQDDIPEVLLELRKQAYDGYGTSALWNAAGHITISGIRAVADGLRMHGDMAAAMLAADILETIDGLEEGVRDSGVSHAIGRLPERDSQDHSPQP